MCYPKPGPRCSRHALDDLKRAIKDYSDDPSISNREQMLQAENAYNSSPKGIAKLERAVAQAPEDEQLQLALIEAVERRKLALEMLKSSQMQTQQIEDAERQRTLTAFNGEDTILRSLQPRIDELRAQARGQDLAVAIPMWGTPDSLNGAVINDPSHQEYLQSLLEKEPNWVVRIAMKAKSLFSRNEESESPKQETLAITPPQPTREIEVVRVMPTRRKVAHPYETMAKRVRGSAREVKRAPTPTITTRNAEGQLHQDGDEPAVVLSNGEQQWWVKGKRHRTGGEPAVLRADGGKEWWENGVKTKQEDATIAQKREFLATNRYANSPPPILKMKNGKKHCLDGPAVVFNNGSSEYWVEGKRHRSGDKPAVERKDGTKEYFVDDERHRAGGKPAIVKRNGEKEWWENNRRHNLEGAAMVSRRGVERYFIRGREYTSYADWARGVRAYHRQLAAKQAS